MTMREYLDSKAAFIRKHYGERGFREVGDVVNETIRKSYLFEDGAVWSEITEPIHEEMAGVMHGLPVTATVKMYRTEVWDSENSKSRYLYEIA